MDPHGFQVGKGRSWITETAARAAKAMHQIVETIRASDLSRLNDISSIETLLSPPKDSRNAAWHSTYTAAHDRWLAGDPELVRIERINREKLKLQERQ